MITRAQSLSRRAYLRILVLGIGASAAVGLAGCGGEEKPKVEANTTPSGPTKPAPIKKAVGKNEKEEMFDPREALKKKGGG